MNSASGERNALRGYRWQYDQLAELVYQSLLDRTFVSLRLTDPEAGQVDDLVLVTHAGAIGHQFKSTEAIDSLTFNDLLKQQRTRGGAPAPSWLRSLADGWTALGGPQAKVALVTNQRASMHDAVVKNPTTKPVHNHFANLLKEVLTPLSKGAIVIDDVPAVWGEAMDRIRTEAALATEELAAFLGSLEIRVATGDPLATSDLRRRADIQELSDALHRLVSTSKTVVVLDRAGVLDLVGWTDRVRLLSSHDFPVDLDTYEPLDAAGRCPVGPSRPTRSGVRRSRRTAGLRQVDLAHTVADGLRRPDHPLLRVCTWRWHGTYPE